ncbi:MAG: sodium:proton antiporter [Planctomycetaceae bacterium]|nr:sodium:proton antiporter [Planctomycetaceae bacterium]
MSGNLAPSTNKAPETPFLQALAPFVLLAVLIIYGLIVRPLALQLPPLPLELIFILAASGLVSQLLLTGHRWVDIQASIVKKFQCAIPAFMILFCIGLIIASWIICGTIPMLVYWGLQLINPDYLYLIAFVAPVIFSTLTGTSWGSVGTIGVVLIGIATALDANLGITAGAVIGGAYFGDKLSPLSDTTNLAALAAEVDLHTHIRSMLWTTLPSATIALGIYYAMGVLYPPRLQDGGLADVQLLLDQLSSIFNFSWLILAPAIVVLAGSIFRLPTVPILIASVILASLVAITLQPFTLTDVISTLHQGFNLDSVMPGVQHTPEITNLLDRGGLYALNEPIIIAFMVFIFIGATDKIDAMPTVVNHLMRAVKSPRGTVLASLLATGITNAMTSNQFATSFIVGDAFKSKYDQQKVPRKVLSRSLEDTGTMLESLVPWHTSAIYMVVTLGVPFSEYWHWQCLSLCNIVIATILAATGVGCFYPRKPNVN